MTSRLAAVRDQRGGVLIITSLFMIVLVGFAALTVDVGNSMLQKRRLQAAVDFAALAASKDLPNDTSAKKTATTMAAANYKAPYPITTTVTTGCVTSGCSANDRVTVKASASIPTLFAGLLGIKRQNVSTVASACGPCDQTTTIVRHDIVIVLDRSLSMCIDSAGNVQDCSNSSTDLQKAIAAIKQGMLPAFNPTYDRIGLALIPGGPACTDYTSQANSALNNGYNGKFPGTINSWFDNSSGWLAVSLAQDNGQFQQTSGTLQSTLTCLDANLFTSTAPAIWSAKQELVNNGRSNAQKIIVYLGDGGANTQPAKRAASDGTATSETPGWWYTATTGNALKPCQDAVGQATAAKNAGITIYSIGYSLSDSDSSQACFQGNRPLNGSYYETTSGGARVYPTATVRSIASDDAHYKATASSSELKSIFQGIATQITSSGYRLTQ